MLVFIQVFRSLIAIYIWQGASVIQAKEKRVNICEAWSSKLDPWLQKNVVIYKIPLFQVLPQLYHEK